MILFIASLNCRVILVDDLQSSKNTIAPENMRHMSTDKADMSHINKLNDLFKEYEKDGLTKEDILKALRDARDDPSTVRDEWLPSKKTGSLFNNVLTGKDDGSARYFDEIDLLESGRNEKNGGSLTEREYVLKHEPSSRGPLAYDPFHLDNHPLTQIPSYSQNNRFEYPEKDFTEYARGNGSDYRGMNTNEHPNTQYRALSSPISPTLSMENPNYQPSYDTQRQYKLSNIQPENHNKRLYVPLVPNYKAKTNTSQTSGYHHFLDDDIQLEEIVSTSPINKQPSSTSSSATESFLNPNLNGNLRKIQTKINNFQHSLRNREDSLNKLQKRLEEQERIKKKNTDLLNNLQKNIERNEKELKQKIASLKLLNNEINEKRKVLNALQYDYNKKQKEKDLINDLLNQYGSGINGIENKIDSADNLIKNLTNEKNSENEKVCKEKDKLHNLLKERNQDMQKLQEALFKLGKEN